MVCTATKLKLMSEIDELDPDSKHYISIKTDLDNRLYSMYDKIEDLEKSLAEAMVKKQAIEEEKMTIDNVYRILSSFDLLYSKMDNAEKRRLMETLISEIQIYEDRQPSGRWIKSIKFNLPVVTKENIEIGLDNEDHVECCVLLER